ncbi:MAG TPA: hypothetical protein VLM41_00980 [Steroidobacteraceae bacterium]|nr:hypothetical protein [Steroidobacteraceae bacterium]
MDSYQLDVPPDVTDARGRFREIFCAVLEQHGTGLPDYRPCEQALTPVDSEPTGRAEPVPLGMSTRRLIAVLVPGVGYGCIVDWLRRPSAGANHVGKFGYRQIVLQVDPLSGIETNARQIRDAILAMPEEPGPPRLVLVGYSKGAPDILEAVVRYPEIRSRVAAVVSSAGAVGGSPLANDMQQYHAELFRYWPGADCGKGDGGAVASLRPDVRRRWMAENPLPQELRYYSLVTLPTPERVSRIVQKSYRKLGRIDWRNDSQLIYYDQILPGSTLIGFLNADHWAIAIPVNRSHPAIARSFADQNDYPREALLEALLRFIEEDLDRQDGRSWDSSVNR